MQSIVHLVSFVVIVYGPTYLPGPIMNKGKYRKGINTRFKADKVWDYF